MHWLTIFNVGNLRMRISVLKRIYLRDPKNKLSQKKISYVLRSVFARIKDVYRYEDEVSK